MSQLTIFLYVSLNPPSPIRQKGVHSLPILGGSQGRCSDYETVLCILKIAFEICPQPVLAQTPYLLTLCPPLGRALGFCSDGAVVLQLTLSCTHAPGDGRVCLVPHCCSLCFSEHGLGSGWALLEPHPHFYMMALKPAPVVRQDAGFWGQSAVECPLLCFPSAILSLPFYSCLCLRLASWVYPQCTPRS